MQNKYPAIAKGYGVFIEPDKGYIFSCGECTIRLLILEHINAQACAILEQCTGSKTVTEITEMLEKQFEETPPDLSCEVETFLDAAFEKGYISYRTTPGRMQGIIRGSTAYYTPTQVVFEVTTGCNLHCGHCLLSAGEPLPDELSPSQLITIAERLFEIGVTQLTLSGGEVLTKKGWDALLEFCVQRFECILFTNGTLITPDIADTLTRLKQVHVSLYGACADRYEMLTQVKGSFARAVQGITLLTERGIPVSASIPVTPVNLEHVDDIINLALFLKCSTARVGMVIPLGRAQTHQWELTEPQKKWLESHVDYAREKYKDVITIEWEEDFEKKERTCGAGCTKWAIASNGDVYPCVLFRTPLGNLTKEDPLTICTSSALLQGIKTPHEGICGDCSFLSQCKGCHGQAHARYFKVDHCHWAQQRGIELLKH